MKILVNASGTREAEATFPIFSKHVLDNSTIYMRRTSEGGRLREVSLQLDDFAGRGRLRAEIEIDEDFQFDPRSTEEYSLGLGEYASSEKEFNEAVADFMDMVQSARITQ